MTKTELAKEIYKASHLTGKFQLRSGAISSEYFDKYQFESRPSLLSEIAKHFIKGLTTDFDLLAGLEMGGIPIATAISLQSGKPAIFVRKKAKEYGTMKLAEGIEFRDKNILLVEDVITSGGQVVMSAKELMERGAHISAVICVIDREAGGRKAIEQDLGLPLFPLFTMTELKKQS